MATHSSILAWRIHMDRGTWRACKELDTTEQLSIALSGNPKGEEFAGKI